MASIVSKLARAAFATRASPSAVGAIAGGGSPAAPIRVSSAGFKYLDVDAKVFESDDAMWAFYEYWCKYHGISRDRREMARRFKTFSATARRVHKFNSSGVDGRLAMNKFADMTQREIYPRPTWRSKN